MTNSLLAEGITIGGQTIESPLKGPQGQSITNIGDLINILVPFLISLAGVVLLVIILWGGYDLMTSQGTPEKIKNAQAKLTSGLIGFVLLISAYMITRLISYIFGIGQGIF